MTTKSCGRRHGNCQCTSVEECIYHGVAQSVGMTREAVSRVIDPLPWYRKDAGYPHDLDAGIIHQSLVKADAILALASQPSPAATVCVHKTCDDPEWCETPPSGCRYDHSSADSSGLSCANCKSALDEQDAPLVCGMCREMGASPSLIQRTTELLDEADQLIKREGASDDARAVANALANGIEDLLKVMRGNRYAMPTEPQSVAWRPIEIAPKDGTPVLLGFPGHFHAMHGHYEDGTWGQLDSDFGFEHLPTQPTHWMHLPASPVTRPNRESDK